MLRIWRAVSHQLVSCGGRGRCLPLALLAATLATPSAAEICTLHDASDAKQMELIGKLDKSPNAVHRHYTLEHSADPDLRSCQLVLTLGSTAAERMIKRKGPVMHAMLRREQFLAFYPQPPLHPRGAVYSDTPLRDYMSLIDATLPNRRKILVFGSERTQSLYTRLRAEAQRVGRELEMLSHQDDVLFDELLRHHAGEDVVLLILPDPHVFNSDTARPIIIAAYQRAVPMVTYAPSLVRAGSLMAVYRTLDDQAAELERHITSWKDNGRLPSAAYASGYSISINYLLARAMRLTIPTKQAVLDTMRRVDSDE